jgi:hypothetical protein
MNRDPRIQPTTLADLKAWLASEESQQADTWGRCLSASQGGTTLTPDRIRLWRTP